MPEAVGLPLASTARGAPDQVVVGLWDLFAQSFDLFTVVLLAGSIAAVAIITRAVMDIRASRLIPRESVRALREHAAAGRVDELRTRARDDGSFAGVVVRAALEAMDSTGSADAVREAAELAAAEESARWFRRIEPLNVIGNLGPLVGLAGTVWGMILAFTALGETGGQASPAALSVGIAKALFHTLLGLLVATPCLLAFGFYRLSLDRLCTRATAEASGIVDHLAERARAGGS